MGVMPLPHAVLAITVAALWGINFIAVDLSLNLYPPLCLAALRFGLVAVPTLLFVPPPQVPWRWLVGYGIGFGVLQFAFLYWGMAIGMPPGLASLVLQASAPFTVLLGMVFLGERLAPARKVGIGVAMTGLALVGWQRFEHAALLPFLLTLAAGLGWALGNIASRQARTHEPMRLMLWMTVIPPVPLALLSLLFEGHERIGAAFAVALTTEGMSATLGLVFTVAVAVVAGSGIWTWLLARHPAGWVAPFSLLVPVFGTASAWVVLGEMVRPGELAGAVLVVGGVLIGSVSLRRRRNLPAG